MGRASTFADPEVLALTQSTFVPVCTDDWYTRRRRDSEGDFFRRVADQSPRQGIDGATRQGIYVFTADGELLGFKNQGGNTTAMKALFREAKERFDKLPEARRTPGAVHIPEAGPPDPNYHREFPAGGLALKVHGRILETAGEGFRAGSCEFVGGDRASRDYCWLTAAEVASLLPGHRKLGLVFDVPKPIRERLARFHLIDNTRGEPAFWSRDDFRDLRMTLTVTRVENEIVELRLGGVAHLESAAAGYEPKLRGELQFRAETCERFDLVGVGDYWGESTFTPGSRPGRTPFGVSMELADRRKPSEQIVPQGLREPDRYFNGR